MSISTTTRKAGPFTGNGVTVSFPFAFKVFAAADVLVVRGEVDTPAELELTLGTHYSVTLNSNQDATPGGSVNWIGTPLSSAYTLTIGSKVAMTQPASFTNLGRFYPRALNDALDRVTIVVQQLGEQVGRSLKVNFSSAGEATPDALLASLGAATAAATEAAGSAAASAVTASTAASAAAGAVAGAVQRDGSVAMTAGLPLAGNATAPLHAVPKQQLESAVAAATRADLSALGVTVAANAMTCALPAEVLNFQSTTPNDGAAFARTYAGGSLTVPSGATLGTTNGTPARIVWGLIDNAGTPEPFVVNAGGTANLDETALISTTAISSGANSPNTFYSQTARSNVSFRIRGWCDVTQATAGTWATAPSKVCGASIQTLKPIQGRGRVPQAVLASRTFGVTYYNTTGYEIFVHVNIQWTSGSGASRLTVDGVAFDGNVISSSTQTSQINVPVPPGGSYIMTGTGSLGFSFFGWNESR